MYGENGAADSTNYDRCAGNVGLRIRRSQTKPRSRMRAIKTLFQPLIPHVVTMTEKCYVPQRRRTDVEEGSRFLRWSQGACGCQLEWASVLDEGSCWPCSTHLWNGVGAVLELSLQAREGNVYFTGSAERVALTERVATRWHLQVRRLSL